MPYNFRFERELHHSYYFTTVNEVKYEVRFKDFFYLFDDANVYAKSTYEFSIILLANHDAPIDKDIAPTIALIFDDFFLRQTETVAIYVCDSSDGRQMARHRKFSDWFVYFGREQYIKVDVLLEEDTEQIPVSLVLHYKNPYKNMIIEEFERITDGYGQIGK